MTIYAHTQHDSDTIAVAINNLDADALQRVTTATGYAAHCSADVAVKLADNVRLLRVAKCTVKQCRRGYLYQQTLRDVVSIALCMYGADGLADIIHNIHN